MHLTVNNDKITKRSLTNRRISSYVHACMYTHGRLINCMVQTFGAIMYGTYIFTQWPISLRSVFSGISFILFHVVQSNMSWIHCKTFVSGDSSLWRQETRADVLTGLIFVNDKWKWKCIKSLLLSGSVKMIFSVTRTELDLTVMVTLIQ